MKRFNLFISLFILVFLLTACAAAQGVAQDVVTLPDQLQAALAVAVAWVVSLLLKGRIPDDLVLEISGFITTAVIGIVGVLLKLIPTSFEGIAIALLNVLVVILGGLLLVFRILPRFARFTVSKLKA